jgi:aminoglycoside phosphotransferase (APT) family kinase protein
MRLCSWIEAQLGGTVVGCRKQDRWRDSWEVDLSRDGIAVALFARGDRNEEFPPDPLEFEAAMMSTLGQRGVPVPGIHGICPDPHAIVMERSPGRANLATARDDQERVSVLEELGEIIAKMHQLDVDAFFAAGAFRPSTPAEIALPYFRACEQLYRRHKAEPEPRIEFFIRWVYRNVPPPPERLSFLHGDPGQFLFEDGRVTVMLDFELSCVGDPMMDIAGLRQRSLAEPMGDIRPLLRRYVTETNATLDPHRISYHSAQWLAASSVLMAAALRHPRTEAGYHEYLSWYVGCMLSALQAVAEHDDFELPAPAAAQAPPDSSSRWSPFFTCLADKFRPSGGDVHGYERIVGASLTQLATNVDRFGAWAEAEYTEDVASMVGTRPRDWRDADALLEAFVLDAGPEHDQRIVEIFHRWLVRQAVLIEGTYTHPFGRMVPISELLDL